MKRFLLSTALALAAVSPSAATPAASPADCAFYEAAYTAVAPKLAAARYHRTPQVFATATGSRPHNPDYGRPRQLRGPLGPSVDLGACAALAARIAADGAPMRLGPPPRRLEGVTVESFSRPVARSGTVQVTYYLGPVAGVDVRLRQTAAGWIVEAAAAWETIVVT